MAPAAGVVVVGYPVGLRLGGGVGGGELLWWVRSVLRHLQVM